MGNKYEIKNSNKKLSTRISPLRKYVSRNQASLNRHQASPQAIHKTTANFIPSLCPNSKHLTKFDAIYHQKSPSRTVTVEQAQEIGKRLYSGKLNDGKNMVRKHQNLKIIKQTKIDDQQRECTFHPDTSLTRKRNELLYDKMKSRSQSREREPRHNTRNVTDSNKLMLKGIEFKNFNTISEESDNINSRNIMGKNVKNNNNLQSLKSSASHSVLLVNTNKQPSPKRTFKEFYAQQMQHVKNKTEKLQNNLYKRDRIFEEMKKQREHVKHLSENSRRILTRSRSREKSKERSKLLDASLNSKEMSMTMKSSQEFGLKTVHERLFNEQKIKVHNQTMIQFMEHLKCQNMIKYGGRSRSSKRKYNSKNYLVQSHSLGRLSRPISNLKSKLVRQDLKSNKSSRSRSQRKIDPEADQITQKLYEDAMKRIKNNKNQEIKIEKECKRNKLKPVTETSNKYLCKRFIEDYSLILKKKKIKKDSLTYQKVEEIVKELGFVTKQYLKDENEEKVLFVDLWG